jgi:ABC-type branched-subunit amino acid transport system substrate-binding protein
VARSGLGVVVVGLVAGLVVAGCSSSGGSSAAAGSSVAGSPSSAVAVAPSSAGAASSVAGSAVPVSSAPVAGSSAPAAVGSASGVPVKVMVITRLSSPQGAFPGVPIMAAAKAAEINAAGGINGRPVSVEICDDHADGTDAETCARKAVADKVVAVVGSYSTNDDSVFPILSAAGIPDFADFLGVPADYTDPDSYPTTGGTVAGFAAMALGAVAQGAKKIAVVRLGIPPTDPPMASITGALKTKGLTVAADIKVPLTATDLSSYAQKAVSGGADAVYVILSNAQFGSLLTAISATGKHPMIIGIDTAITPQLVSQFGSALEGAVVGHYYLPLDNPAMAAFNAAVTKTGKSFPVDFPSENAYIGLGLFAQIAGTVSGELTAASFKQVLDTTSGITTGGITPTLQWKTPFDVKGFNRLTDRQATYSLVKGGKIVDSGAGYIDTTAAIEAEPVS